MARVRWLQLPPLLGLRGKFEAAFLETLVHACDEGPIDAIVVPGDVAMAALPDEYERAGAFIAALRSRLTSAPHGPALLVVPGNHDRSRDGGALAARVLDRWHEDEELRRDVFRPEEQELRSLAMRGFEEFAAWHDTVRSPDAMTGLLTGDQASARQIGGARVGFVGLNSELLTVLKTKAHFRGMIARPQLDALAPVVAGADAVFVATHAGPRSLDATSVDALSAMFGGRGLMLTSRNHGMARRADLTWIGLQREGTLGAVGEVDTVTLDGKVTILEPSGPTSSKFHLGREAPRSTQAVRSSASVSAVSVTNFRGLARLAINLARGAQSPLGGNWTCLAGLNGAGKSTILQAVALSLLPERDVLQLGTSRLGRMRRRRVPVSYDAKVELVLSEDSRRTLTIDEKGPHGDGELNVLVVGYGATRNLSDNIDSRTSSLSPRVRGVLTLFDPLAQLARVEALLTTGPTLSPRLLSLITQLAQKVLVDDIEVLVEHGRVMFRLRGDEVEALDLPDGFRSTLAWVADLASAWMEHAPDGGDDVAAIEAIVLVDEIDLHLHPSLQRNLVTRLRAALPRCQFIVTTHSPLILSSFHALEIVGLDRAEPTGVRFVDRPILGFSMDQIYEWLMGTRPSSALLEEQLALPEGERQLSEAELAEALTVSPTVDTDEARAQILRRAELVAKLRSGKL